MENFYYVVFGLLALMCLGVELRKEKAEKTISSEGFKSFRNNYLLVYTLMMAGDWLQGPYVYALYAYYGYSVGDIGKLFIAGFGSSMIFGTAVGSLADKMGRKKACMVYVVTYVGSCVTKHWSNYNVLMLGRVFGGIATSLLFSSFESWLVAEHFKRGYEGAWLSGVFSKAVFLGNGVAAIVAGLIANTLVHSMDFGPVAPFDAAIVVLVLGGIMIATTWTENFGDNSATAPSLVQQFRNAFNAIKTDPKVGVLGAVQSLFEASMYTFVFLWTPALSPNDEDIPHGFIFATFMLACMVGSAIAGKLMARASLRIEVYMQGVFMVSAASLFAPVLVRDGQPNDDGTITMSIKLKFLAFVLFEGCVGIFWPSIMKMRAQYIPEEQRATIMNFFRIPLNIFVCVVLYNVKYFSMETMFTMCASFLGFCVFCQRSLASMAAAGNS